MLADENLNQLPTKPQQTPAEIKASPQQPQTQQEQISAQQSEIVQQPQQQPQEITPQQPQQTQPAETAIQPEQVKPQQQKKELFVRQEIKTMRKDMARLLEEVSVKERGKMAGLKTAEEVRKEKERLARLKTEEKEKMFAVKELRGKAAVTPTVPAGPSAPIAPSMTSAQETQKMPYQPPGALPRKPSFFDKFLSRIVLLIVLIVFLGIIITFGYWFFFIRAKKASPPPPPPPPPQQQIPTPQIPPIQTTSPEQTAITTGEPSTNPQPPAPPQIPQSLLPIDIDKDYSIEFATEDELPMLFSEGIKEYGGENILTRVFIRNSRTNSIISLPDFFRIFSISAPEKIINKFSPEFTLFIYSSQIANRFGFIAKINGASIEEFRGAMLSWEGTMEKDTERLFVLLGKREPSTQKTFRQALYKGVAFRYISFPTINFGMVWSTVSLKEPTIDNPNNVNNYLIFSSSGESMMRVLDRIINKLVK